MAKQINARIITKHDIAANWAKAINFIPKEGEIIVYEPDAQVGISSVARLKVGDGITKIGNLKFVTDPYVEKQTGYGLSQNNFTDTYKDLIDKILALGDKASFENTTYISGPGLSLAEDNGNIFTNTVLLEVKYNTSNKEMIFTTYDIVDRVYKENTINLFEIFSDCLSIAQDATPPFISEGEEKGKILVGGEGVSVHGLGELAFENKSYINDLITDATGEKELYIGPQEGLSGEKLWIEPKDNGVVFLRYREPFTNNYEIYSPLQIGYDENYPWKMNFFTGQENYTLNTGIFTNSIQIPQNSNLNGCTQPGIYYSPSGDHSSTITNIPNNVETGFKLIVLEGYDSTIVHQTVLLFNNNIFYRTYQDSEGGAWTDWVNLAVPDDFLKLTGGTVTGVTTFSNTTDSTSTTTGALKITGGLGVEKNIYASKVFGAVWNDYAEYRNANTIEPGRCIRDTEKGEMILTEERLQPSCKIVSDTFGFSIGQTEKNQTPTAVAGRVLAYGYENRKEFNIGDAVCSGPNGTVSRMTREEIINYPDRIVGIVSEIPDYKTWGEKNIEVKERIWIYVR